MELEVHSGETADQEISIDHGEVVRLKGGRRIQAHVAAVCSQADILTIISTLQKDRAWEDVSYWPFAMRFLDDREQEQEQTMDILSCSQDGGCIGVGSKLVHLLERWEVFNVAILLTVWEGDTPRTSRGSMGTFFKAVIDTSKQVLEKCFLDTLGERVSELSKQSVTEYFRNKCSGACNVPADFSSLSFLASIVMEQQSSSDLRSESQLTVATPHVKSARNRDPSNRKPLVFPGYTIGADAFSMESSFERPVKFEGKKNIPPGHYLFGRQQAKKKGKIGRGNAAKQEEYLRVLSEPPSFTVEEVRELRSLTKPNQPTAQVFAQVAKLLGEVNTDWLSVRTIFRELDLSKKLEDIIITRSQANDLEDWVRVNVPTVRERATYFKTSPTTGKAVDWLLCIAASTAQSNPNKALLQDSTSTTLSTNQFDSPRRNTPRRNRIKSRKATATST